MLGEMQKNTPFTKQVWTAERSSHRPFGKANATRQQIKN